MTNNQPEKEELIEVNELLGKQPSIGLLTANQILPIILIIIICYVLTEGFFSFGFVWTGICSLWSIAVWLLLTGNDPDRYLNKFRKPIQRNWTIGGTLYISPLLSQKRRAKLVRLELVKRQKRR